MIVTLLCVCVYTSTEKGKKKIKKKKSRVSKKEAKTERTRPSGPIRCDVWIVEQMRYPTDRPTDGHSQS